MGVSSGHEQQQQQQKLVHKSQSITNKTFKLNFSILKYQIKNREQAQKSKVYFCIYSHPINQPINWAGEEKNI